MSVKRLVPLNVLSSSSAPTGSRSGDMYYNTTTGLLNVYNGTSWASTSGSSVAAYQSPAPTSPSTGALWVDSAGTASGLNQNDYLTKADAATTYQVPHPFLLAGM